MTSELVERAQRGDHEAFDALATAAYHRLYAIARRILRDGYAAEDAVQDALVRAWRDVKGLRDPKAFDAWLHRLLVHACYREARQVKRREVAEIQLDVPVERPHADSQDRTALIDQLERGFRRLTPEQRVVLVLHHYLGMADGEAAIVLEIPVGTFRTRLHRAAAAMRAALEADERMPAATRESLA